MAEGVFPKFDGDILFASEVNKFNEGIIQIYTGAGFDSALTSTGTDEQDHELDAVGAVGSDFVKVRITGTALTQSEDAETTRVQLKAQIKETGGAYADIIAYVDTNRQLNVNTSPTHMYTTYTYEVIATLTAGMKTNGFQIKAFSKSIVQGSAEDASFTNIQTVVELA